MLENNKWLFVTVLSTAQLLLKRQFSSISGLQTPILQNTGFHIESYPAILFIGKYDINACTFKGTIIFRIQSLDLHLLNETRKGFTNGFVTTLFYIEEIYSSLDLISILIFIGFFTNKCLVCLTTGRLYRLCIICNC